jgi:hypothetical protein
LRQEEAPVSPQACLQFEFDALALRRAVAPCCKRRANGASDHPTEAFGAGAAGAAGAGAAGGWVKDPAFCGAPPGLFACTPDGHRYAGIRSAGEPCALLAGAGVTDIRLCGDSYMRHVYQALVMVLQGDYRYAAVPESAGDQCAGERQFRSDQCRAHVLREASACHGQLRVAYTGEFYCNQWYRGDPDSTALFVVSGGSHPVHGNYTSRYGVNDPQAASRWVLSECCARRVLRSNMVFLMPHARASWRHRDECPERVRRLVAGLYAPLRERCGIHRIVNPHAFTAELVAVAGGNASLLHLLSPDGMHWGRAVNVLKAWQLVAEAARPTPAHEPPCAAAYLATTLQDELPQEQCAQPAPP